MAEFKYTINPDRVYTLSYDGENGKMEKEVSGKEILAMFRRDAFLEKLLTIDDLTDELTPENIHEDLEW